MGSIVHAKMLGKAGVLSPAESRRLVAALRRVWRLHRDGRFVLDDSMEDVHMGVESLVTRFAGRAGEKLHSGRSRNDQVALDLRLYARLRAAEAAKATADLANAVLSVADRNRRTVMPGYTHMQPAQPVTLAHHLLAHAARFLRDSERFLHLRSTLNHSPLGAGALAGTHLPIDRSRTALALGFEAPVDSTMDAVSDRAYLAELVFACALHMIHLSSLAEELIIWSGPGFGFVRLPETHTTGSSIMPQKRNPDVCELIRAKAAVVSQQSGAVLGVLKGLPQAYNRDLQELKPLLTESLTTTCLSAALMAEMVSGASFDRVRLKQALDAGFLEATDVAEALVLRGVPFRRAHHVTGRAVRLADAKGHRLTELDPKEAASIYEELPVVLEGLKRARGATLRNTAGGPHPEATQRTLKRLRSRCAAAQQKARFFLRSERRIEQRVLRP